jgi:hypothetical protein
MINPLRTVLVAGLLVGAACGGKKKEDAPAGDKAAVAVSAPPVATASAVRTANSPVVKELLALVPEQAFALGFVDAGGPFWDQVMSSPMVGMFPFNRKELEADLRSLLEKRVGIDPFALEGLVGFGMVDGGQPAVAVMSRGIKGDVTGSSKEGRQLDRDLWLAQRGSTVFLGMSSAVKAALAVHDGGRGLLATNKEFAALWDAETTGANLAGLVNVAAIPKAGVEAGRFGLEKISMRADAGGIRLIGHGDGTKLGVLAGLIDAGIGQATAQMTKARALAQDPEAPLEAALGGIVGYHMGMSSIAMMKPKLAGNKLTIEAPIPALGSYTGIVTIGVLTAVAIPAYMDYMNRSRMNREMVLPSEMPAP